MLLITAWSISYDDEGEYMHSFFPSYFLHFTKNYFLRIIFIVVSQCVKGKARTKHTVKQINEWML